MTARECGQLIETIFRRIIYFKKKEIPAADCEHFFLYVQ